MTASRYQKHHGSMEHISDPASGENGTYTDRSHSTILNDNFLFKSVLTLEPLIQHWQLLAEQEEGIRSEYARQIIHAVDSHPELKEPITDFDILTPYEELVKVLMSDMLPVGSADHTYATAVLPYKPQSFFSTPGFERLNLLSHLIKFFENQKELMTIGRALSAYSQIFLHLYGDELIPKLPFFFPVEEEETGLVRYFTLSFDSRCTTIVTRGEVPDLTEEEKSRLYDDRMNLELWKTLLPPEHFEFHGFGVMVAVEVTQGQLISAIQKDLLEKDALNSSGKINILQSRIRSLMRQPSLEMGLIAIDHGEFDSIASIQPLGKSLLLSKGWAPNCPLWNKSVYSDVSHEWCEPKVISDLNKYDGRTGFEEHLIQQGYRSLLLAPLYSEDRLVGILELGSKTAHDLNTSSLHYLEEVTSLLAVAVHREISEKEDRVQAIIKQQYTSIHPTVEWRFRKAAEHYLQQERQEGVAMVDSIVFQGVYPLYGLSDIRGSSNERNASIQADLIEQLRLAQAVLIEAQKYRPLFVIEEIGYRIEEYIKEITNELRSGDEISLLQFLSDEVAGLFDELASFGPDVKSAIDEYQSAIDPELQVLYKRRKEYEESVSIINSTISSYIESQEVEAQEMYPHFFEMFKTDGVDYNIYVGPSLVENRSYNSLYLRNLRLWQLRMMCGVHWEMQKLMPALNVPLQTAHLILVQNIPISIRFRIDEKKFDVDGAYNIRYEIVKKRIDKAIVSGTGERLTQPGKIAIVYSQAEEAVEYLRYIRYLQSAGYLKKEIEELELGDMQGVHGLKALRVTVNEEDALKAHPLRSASYASQNGDGRFGAEEVVVEVDRP